MSLAGLGAVTLWHDVAAGAHDDFREWHTREHMPEHVGIPGFQRGRRFVAISGAPEFFVLYEADTPGTLHGQDYAHRVAAPSDATRRALATFRNVSRSACRVAFTSGVGSGGVMLTLRFAIDEPRRDGTLDALRRRLLPALVYRKGIGGIHLCIPDDGSSPAPAIPPEVAAPEPAVARWAALIEGASVPDVDAAADDLSPALAAHGATAVERAVYRLENTRLRTPWAAG